MQPFDQAWALLKASDISFQDSFDYYMEDPENRQMYEGGHDPSQGEMPVMPMIASGGGSVHYGTEGVSGAGMEASPYAPAPKEHMDYYRNLTDKDDIDWADEIAVAHLLEGAFQQAPIVNAMASIGEDVSGFPKTPTRRIQRPLTSFADSYGFGVVPHKPVEQILREVDPKYTDPILATLGIKPREEPTDFERKKIEERAALIAAEERAARNKQRAANRARDIRVIREAKAREKASREPKSFRRNIMGQIEYEKPKSFGQMPKPQTGNINPHPPGTTAHLNWNRLNRNRG